MECELCGSLITPMPVKVVTGQTEIPATQMECSNSECTNAFMTQEEDKRVAGLIVEEQMKKQGW